LFVPYVMGGYPSIDASARHAAILAEHADIIELGIPFSDPLADGPTIQAAGQRALDQGTRPSDVLAIAAGLKGGPPVVVSPAEVVTPLNNLFRADNQAGLYFTILYGVLHAPTGLLRFTNRCGYATDRLGHFTGLATTKTHTSLTVTDCSQRSK
jgi:tryptophan synthase alpha subunit